MLYQDSFEVCNPIGSSKKKHKILGVYLTLANFRPHVRSNIDQIVLVLLCKEVDFKYFGQRAIFSRLIDDLKDLENNGIDIIDGKEPIKGGLCAILGDNLGSHCIGGFVENFSSVSHWCRWCLLEGQEFQEDPCSIGQLRNEENYQLALEELSQLNDGHRPPVVIHVQGVKFDSLFNELDSFHVCKNGLPPCLGHDLFEGVVNNDVALILKHLIKQNKWFTYSYLNQRISQFKYRGSDKSNQPCPVTPNAEKLSGQAVQNWTLVRLLPLLVRDKINEPNDEHWQLFLKLRQIIELVCAPQISEAQIAVLNYIVDEYLEDRFSLFPDSRMKPKHHFIKGIL